MIKSESPLPTHRGKSMLRITVLSLLVLAAASKSLAQGASNIVDLPLDVRSGMSVDFDYEVRRSLNNVREEAIATAQMTIDEVGNPGFAATYTLNSMIANGMRIDSDNRDAMRYFLGAPVNFVADEDGSPLRIADRERLVRDVLASDAFAGAAPELQARISGFLRNGSDLTLTNNFLELPELISRCHGYQLELNVPLQTTVQTPFDLARTVVDAVVTVELTSLDETSRTATIEAGVEIDPVQVQDLVDEFLANSGIAVEDLSNEELETLRTMDYRETTTCTVDIDSGWVRKLTHRSNATAMGQSMGELYKLKVSTTFPPAR